MSCHKRSPILPQRSPHRLPCQSIFCKGESPSSIAASKHKGDQLVTSANNIFHWRAWRRPSFLCYFRLGASYPIDRGVRESHKLNNVYTKHVTSKDNSIVPIVLAQRLAMTSTTVPSPEWGSNLGEYEYMQLYQSLHEMVFACGGTLYLLWVSNVAAVVTFSRCQDLAKRYPNIYLMYHLSSGWCIDVTLSRY